MGVRIGTHSQPASPGANPRSAGQPRSPAQPSQPAPEPGPAQPSLGASLPQSIRKPRENQTKLKNPKHPTSNHSKSIEKTKKN